MTLPADPPDGAALGHELSLWVVLFHDAVATRLGLNATEHKVLDLIARNAGVSPTGIARHTGLSNAAVTKIATRLVELDHVRRERDPTDGRRWGLTVTDGYRHAMAGLYAPMIDGMTRLSAQFTEAEGRAVTRWIIGTVEVMRAATRQLAER